MQSDTTIKEYKCIKYISISPFTQIESIANIGEVITTDEIPTTTTTMTGEIVTVTNVQKYVSCILCKAKVDETTSTCKGCRYKKLVVQ